MPGGTLRPYVEGLPIGQRYSVYMSVLRSRVWESFHHGGVKKQYIQLLCVAQEPILLLSKEMMELIQNLINILIWYLLPLIKKVIYTFPRLLSSFLIVKIRHGLKQQKATIKPFLVIGFNRVSL